MRGIDVKGGKICHKMKLVLPPLWSGLVCPPHPDPATCCCCCCCCLWWWCSSSWLWWWLQQRWEWEPKWKVVAQFPKDGLILTTTSQAVCAPSGAWRRRREQRGRGGGGLPSAGEGGVLLCFSLLRTKIINFKENDFEASCICQMKSTLLVDYGWLGWFGHLAGLARVLRSRCWSFPSQTILFVGGWTLFFIIFHFNFWPHQTYNGLCYVSPLVS